MDKPSRRWFQIANIHVGTRLRAPNDAVIADLAKSISAVGLLNPPVVRIVEEMEIDGEDWEGVPVLIAGLHRLKALASMGETHVECIVYDADDVKAELIEITENLHRADLSALERDEQLARWMELTEEKARAEVSAQVEQKPKGGRPEGGEAAAARDLGVSRGDAQRAKAVASLAPEAKQAARDIGLDDNRTAMLKAAKEKTPDAQVAALQRHADEKAATKVAAPVNFSLPPVAPQPEMTEAERLAIAIASVRALSLEGRQELVNILGDELPTKTILSDHLVTVEAA